ncbi:hypothetical protein QUB05_02475 [Microcoleus sp. F10-C6]|uniref:hypothetical protein n=1 Tax=unclassified Microcoleus TaxID=2642155 RepID=UPI002FD1375C
MRSSLYALFILYQPDPGSLFTFDLGDYLIAPYPQNHRSGVAIAAGLSLEITKLLILGSPTGFFASGATGKPRFLVKKTDFFQVPSHIKSGGIGINITHSQDTAPCRFPTTINRAIGRETAMPCPLQIIGVGHGNAVSSVACSASS